MNIQYGASRSDAYAALTAMDNKTLRRAFDQLQADIDGANRRYFLDIVGGFVLTTAVSLGLFYLLNDWFPVTETFWYWTFHLTDSVLVPFIGIGLISRRITKPYWIWRGHFRIWLKAIDTVTFERFGNP